VTMQPNDTNLRYTTLVTWPAYSGTFRLKVGAKLKIDPILNDNSIPRISGLFDALYYFTRAAVKSRQKQGDGENADTQMAQQMFEQCKRNELSAMAAFQQVVPKVYDDPHETWDWGDNSGLWGYGGV
jgi:hypothetical protein